ncbi:translation initiation factor IF-2, chloroplastic-like [Actinidia eriantha]|uniref:translation initiation factor IF-2, chloroplastic-like n=1 Tax=Actinidia eriantha TaxID=165200 RepID=UPI002588F1A4|nr:translation initiation factor IF-2, chloroplastic-like [Actinidia eriantha]
MASLSSLVGLGSSSGTFKNPVSLVHRVSFDRNIGGFRAICVGKRWRYGGVCRCSITTDLANKGNSLPLVLKAAPKPVLRSAWSTAKLPLNTNLGNSVLWDPPKLSRDSGEEKINDDEEERNREMGSVGEVMPNVEDIETSKRETVSVNKPSTNTTTYRRNGKPGNSTVGCKSKTVRSVWRRGTPVTNVQKVVESPKIEKVEKQEPRLEGVGRVDPQVPVPRRDSQAPARVQHKLHTRPSVAPRVVVRPRVPAPTTPVIGGTDFSAKTIERQPILVDKFASKKQKFDPLIAEAVVARRKRGKGPVPGKFRDEFRKKSGPTGGLRRHMDAGDVEISEEETEELGISIPGVATAHRGRKWSKASRKAARRQAAKEAAPVKAEILEVGDKGMMTKELAYNLAISEGEIMGHLYSKGIKPDGVQKLDKYMVKMICKEYEVEVIDAVPTRLEEMAIKKGILDEDDLDSLEDRPPVLTIMGHVDHGKTTLLDYIRKSKVAASEAGGITQGIGAYKVQVPIDGKLQPCVFLDTPGHEAFGAMRARGARVTDIAIIVVAADDGIRPQTNEAIAHAKAAGVPIVIAINKIDKDGANPERVMQELGSTGLMPEAWGGDIPVVQISALKGENVDDLLETVMLIAELQELKANPHRSAKGTVIEAGLHKSKGPVITFIVQNGTLKRGDIVVCGEAFGKVRALFDDKGNRIDECGPSIPVQVIGLNNVPIAGDEFEVVGSLDVAREKAELCAELLRNERISAKAGEGKVTLSSFASAVSAGKLSGLDLHQLNIIMKVDVQGSIEAVRQALQVLPQDNVTLKFLFQATGEVSTSDIDLAVVSKAIILGFNVKAPSSVKSYAGNKGIEIRLYRVIYDLIDDVRNAMEGLLEPVEEQVKIGSAEVRAIFSAGSGRVAGCMVTEGKVVKGSGIRVVRNGKTVYVGILNSLRRVKEMVKEVNAGLECGIGTEDYGGWEEGDILEAFNTVQNKRTLEEASATMAAAVEGVGIEL